MFKCISGISQYDKCLKAKKTDDIDDFYSEECLIGNDPGKYHYVAQGMLTIDNVDDAEEMKLTDEAFDVLGFTRVCSAKPN